MSRILSSFVILITSPPMSSFSVTYCDREVNIGTGLFHATSQVCFATLYRGIKGRRIGTVFA